METSTQRRHPYTCTQCGRNSKHAGLCSSCGKHVYWRAKPHPCQQCGKVFHSNGRLCCVCAQRKCGRRRRCGACQQCWVPRGQGDLCANCRWNLRHTMQLNRGVSTRLCPSEFKRVVEERIRLYRKRAKKQQNLFTGERAS